MDRMSAGAGLNGRFPVEIEGVVHRPDGRQIPAKISNFSDLGCRVQAPEPFRIGERLQIAVPRIGNLTAQVRWSLPGAAGTRFLTDWDF
jgi:hypothetical protein